MKFTRWVHGVATGRIRHWNDTNNLLIADLWGLVETYDEPMRTALRTSLVSAMQLVERMLGPEVGRNGWIAVDLLTLDRADLQAVYAILVDVFLAFEGILNRALKPSIPPIMNRLFGKPHVAPHITSLLENSPTDFERAANATWLELSTLLNPSASTHITSKFAFVSLFIVSATLTARQRRAI